MKTTTDTRQQDTDQSQEKRAFRKQVRTSTCNLTWKRSRFAKNQRCTESCQTPSTRSKWRRPESSRRSRRETKPSTQEKITQEKINQETECIKIPQNQYTDKVVNVTDCDTGTGFTRFKRCTDRVGDGNPISEFGLDFRFSERAC